MIRVLEKSGHQKFLDKHGIKTAGSSTGFSESENSWYGWSHRAIYGFGIGYKVKKGDVVCKSDDKWSGDFDEGFTCKTLDDCKKVAISFAKGVS